MDNLPLVSVLCLCYNQQKYIIESLESIKAQTYRNFEVLICDDFSKDDSVQVIASWIEKNTELKIKFVKHQENNGITKSLNELLNLSKGKYVQLLALDDILMPDKLDRHVKILENSLESQALVFSDANLIDDQSNLYQNKFIARHLSYLSLKTKNFYKMLLKINFIPAMSPLVKKQIIVAEGGWDESLSYEDHDMWLRLSQNYVFIFDDKISCSYRLHSTNSHQVKSVINHSAIFKTLIKHKESEGMREVLFPHLEKIYREQKLTDEHHIFFKHYPVKYFHERLIKNNFHPKMYVITLRLYQFFNI